MFPAWFRTLRGPTGLITAILAVLVVGLFHAAPLTAQQEAVIQGRVTGPAGQGLANAQVSIPSLNIGAIAGADGSYVLTVPGARITEERVTVQARLIGYRTQTAQVSLRPGAQITQNFELALDPLRLDELVATGAGTERVAERMGTARHTVSADMIQRTAEPNVIQALAAKAPGIVTHQSGGTPGAGTSIRMRGTKTITGLGQPAIIVDGVIVNNESRTVASSTLQGVEATNRAFDLNPDDIESIEVLSGAAASSIFGASAGAGGAILITTRRGEAGRTTFNLRSTAQFDRPIRYIPTQQRFGVGTGGVSGACTTVDCGIPAPSFFSWGPELPAGTQTYDQVRDVFETGAMFDNTLSVSGGSERTTFYLSGGVMRHDGFIFGPADKYNRHTVRVNANHRFIDNLSISGNVSYAQSDGSGVQRGNSINGHILGAVRQPPEFNARQYLDPETGLHRSWRFPNPGPLSLVRDRGFDNPFFAIFENPTSSETSRVFGNITTDWSPLGWLALRSTLGVDYTSDDQMEAHHVSSSGAFSGGGLTRRQYYDRIIDHTLTATATHEFTPEIQGTLTLGQNLNETYFRQIRVVGRQLIAPEPFKLANTVTRDPPTDSETRRRLEGYFASANLDLGDQLFLTGGIRWDGSSSFGLESQRAWYPRASAAWSFSRTLDMPEDGFLTFGKLRAAFGQSGQEPDLYLLQNIFTNALIADFNPGSLLHPTLGGQGGLYSGAVRGNPAIKPERVSEFEGGVDLTLFQARSDLSVTYYYSDAKDIIFNVPLAPSTGFFSTTQNAGHIRNKGWEASLNVRPYQTPDVGVQLGVTFSRNTNEVIDLGGPEVIGYSTSFVGSTTHAIVGEPLGTFQANEFARCGRGLGTLSGHDIAAACQGAPSGALFLGDDGFPIFDPTTRVIGAPDPDWIGGLNAEVNVLGVRASGFLEHRQGGVILNMTRASMYQYGTHGDTEIRGSQVVFGQDYFSDETVVGPGAGTPVTLGQTWFTGLYSIGGARGEFIESATNTRLREISLAYTFGQSFVQRLGLRTIDARITGRNIGMWTDYRGFDPEVSLGGTLLANRGIEWMTNPLPQAWVFTVSLNH